MCVRYSTLARSFWSAFFNIAAGFDAILQTSKLFCCCSCKLTRVSHGDLCVLYNTHVLCLMWNPRKTPTLWLTDSSHRLIPGCCCSSRSATVCPLTSLLNHRILPDLVNTFEVNKVLSFSSVNVADAIFMVVQHKGLSFSLFCHIWWFTKQHSTFTINFVRVGRAEFTAERTRSYYHIHSN